GWRKPSFHSQRRSTMGDAMNTVIEQIRSFFDEHPSAGLILPDGWFGRPYDNLLFFTEVEIFEGQLSIKFAQGEVLELTGDLRIDRSEDSLVIQGFSALVWSWKFYGSDRTERKVFSNGKVEFRGQPLGMQ